VKKGKKEVSVVDTDVLLELQDSKLVKLGRHLSRDSRGKTHEACLSCWNRSDRVESDVAFPWSHLCYQVESSS
jgi:hypothetical protein